MDIGFIGAGTMAGRLMERVDGIDDATIAAVCDVDESAARESADPRGAAAYTDHETFYAETDVDAVFVAIPPFAYEDQVTMAAERGIDVFVEKPVALEPDRGRETLAAIEDAGVVACSGYVFRYDEITETALDLIGDRTISLLDGQYWSGLLASPWGYELERSGGEIVTRSTHVYDLIRYFGGEVERVAAASTERIGTPEVDYSDATTATMVHENGVVSAMSSSITAPDWTVELDVIGEGVRLRLDYAAQEISGTIDGEEIRREQPVDRYRSEVEAFVEAVRRGDPGYVRSDYADALRTLSLNWAVIDAAETGETVTVGETRRS